MSIDRRPRYRRPARGVAALVAVLLVGSGAAGSAIDWDRWSGLTLKARKMLFFTGSIDLDVDTTGANPVMSTVSHARFFGATLTRTHTRTRMDAKLRPLEYVSLSEKRGRHYVFGEEGYTVRKLSPDNGADAPLERWTIKSENYYDYPKNPSGQPRRDVLDYYSMILRLKGSGLDRVGDQVTFWVATSSGPQEFHVRVSERRKGRRDLRDESSGEKTTREVEEFRLRVTPDNPEEARENFLDMEGETELWVEADSKTLLEINGKIPNVPGKIAIEIHSIR